MEVDACGQSNEVEAPLKGLKTNSPTTSCVSKSRYMRASASDSRVPF